MGRGVGGGSDVYRGHCDGSPDSALAVTDENDGWSDTGNFSGDTSNVSGIYGDNQRRTLTLTNGEVIWDFAGNIIEWTDGQTTGGVAEQPGSSSFVNRDWNALENPGIFDIDPYPSSTGIANSASWDAGRGIGKVYSDSSDTTQRGYLRGGGWWSLWNSGVLSLAMHLAPDTVYASVGFRVAK